MSLVVGVWEGGGGVLWKWVKCPLTLNMKIMGNEYLTHFEK